MKHHYIVGVRESKGRYQSPKFGTPRITRWRPSKHAPPVECLEWIFRSKAGADVILGSELIQLKQDLLQDPVWEFLKAEQLGMNIYRIVLRKK